MTELNTSILIPAPPDDVWRVFMFTKGWASLFGGVLVDLGPERPWRADEGRTVGVRPFRSVPPSRVAIQVKVLEPGHLRWTSRAPGLSAVRFFIAEPATGGCLFRNCEHVSGFVPRVMPGFVSRALQRTHEGFNLAFRERVAAARSAA